VGGGWGGGSSNLRKSLGGRAPPDMCMGIRPSLVFPNREGGLWYSAESTHAIIVMALLDGTLKVVFSFAV